MSTSTLGQDGWPDDNRPFKVRTARDGTWTEISLAPLLRWCYSSDYEPHWAIATLL
jgi:hypothetical protein